jgi:hypothetical protein
MNTAESFFSLLKRAIIGAWHHVSHEHLARYPKEFVFRLNTDMTPMASGWRYSSAVSKASAYHIGRCPNVYAFVN